jgi:flagellar M-ring protein FliF
MFGEGNFSTEIQVDLDMNAVTSARESWNKEGAVRSETTQSAPAVETTVGYGVPGALSNTPPPPTQLVPGAPQGTPAPAPAAAAAAPGAPGAAPATAAAPAPELNQSATRTYELGREVAVSNGTPGDIKRLSVAVVLSSGAMASRKPADIAQIKSLVGAAVGANLQRGDQVEVIARKFQSEPAAAAVPFYEEPWFATVLRNGVALICVLLLIFFGLRPAIAAMRRKQEDAGEGPRARIEGGSDAAAAIADGSGAAPTSTEAILTGRLEQMKLADQVGLAQRFISEQPDSAMAAIRQMLAEADPAKADLA